MHNYKSALIIMILILSSPLFGKGSIKIITTTSDLASLAKQVGGDRVDVSSLTLGSRDPHYAQAKPSMIRKLFKADLLLKVGAELEIGWLPALLKRARNKTILPGNSGHFDLSLSIDLLEIPTGEITRDMGDVHASGNPHYWLNPDNSLKIIKAIQQRLIELDPKNQNTYILNAKNFEIKLKQKRLEWNEKLTFLKGQNLVAYHSSLLYLAQAFDFKLSHYIEPKPGISPSAQYLNTLVQQIKQKNIQFMIMEQFYDDRPTRFLNKHTGIHVVKLPQSVGAKKQITDYFSLFDHIVLALTQRNEHD